MDNDNFAFSIMNKHAWITTDVLNSFFEKGYSTKEGCRIRGLGLYNLKRIVNKYKGSILVDNVDIEGENYVRFFINI